MNVNIAWSAKHCGVNAFGIRAHAGVPDHKRSASGAVKLQFLHFPTASQEIFCGSGNRPYSGEGLGVE
jgi:hypothetical protein